MESTPSDSLPALSNQPMPEGSNLPKVLSFLRQPMSPDRGQIIKAQSFWPDLSLILPPHTPPPPPMHPLPCVGHCFANCDAGFTSPSTQYCFFTLPFAGVDLWYLSYALNSISLSTSREPNCDNSWHLGIAFLWSFSRKFLGHMPQNPYLGYVPPSFP